MKTKTWVELPSSKYDIQYVLTSDMMASSAKVLIHLNAKKLIKQYFRKTSVRIWRRPSKVSPFERKVIELDRVTRRDGYGDGTAVMYIREIFEPGDAEYDYIGGYVCAGRLSQEQVDRLRIMIIPPRREDILVSYLDHYKNANQQPQIFNESTDVIRHFEGFHRRYLKLEEGKEKFDLLFSFTFAIKTYSGWIHKIGSSKRRATMIATLAKHWRKLLGRYEPAELGLDLEFSYPATVTFLENFKTMCEGIETFGYPIIEFLYQVKDDIRVEVCFGGIDDDPIAGMTDFTSNNQAVETRLVK